ncbi:MAG: hypothetical protein ABJL99_21545 [Aliishimia sp.]
MAEKKISEHAFSLYLGITVVVLYAFFVLLVTFGFGSYIYRTGWQVEAASAAASDGKDVSIADIDNMLFILNREKTLESQIRATNQRIATLGTELSKKDSLRRQSFATIARSKEDLSIEALYTLADLNEIKSELNASALVKFNVVFTDEFLTPVKRTDALLRLFTSENLSLNADADVGANYESVRLRLQTRWDELNSALVKANGDSHEIQADEKLVSDNIDAEKFTLVSHQESIAALRETLPLGAVVRARLAALSLDIPILPDVLMRLVSFPTIFLTLIVTIAAGGLGTVVSFSRRYYAAKDASSLTMSRLFVNVGEGIAAAIAIFLFSGAGMLALTQGGGASSNSVELSPYTVAFIAFVSGFMAEDAFASIQSAGKRIFSRDPGSDPVTTTGKADPDAPIVKDDS